MKKITKKNLGIISQAITGHGLSGNGKKTSIKHANAVRQNGGSLVITE